MRVKTHKAETSKTSVTGAKKLLGVMKAEKFLMHKPYIKWCLDLTVLRLQQLHLLYIS